MNEEDALKFAAKAVGGEFSPGTTKHRTGETWDEWEWTGPQGISMPDGFTIYPLISNGNALELAAELRIVIKPGKHKGDGCSAETQRAGVAGVVTFREDKCEQMRHAIVYAAAEIGKAMK